MPETRTARSRKKASLSFLALLIILFIAAIPSAAQEMAGSGKSGPVPVYGYRVVNSYPHDRTAFTEGLVYENGTLYEGTGLYDGSGPSTLRQIDLQTGRVHKQIFLDNGLFGEGIAIWKDRLVQLTYTTGIGLVYDKKNLTETGRFSYRSEGWGITSDGLELIMSDGSEKLHLLDPETFEEKGLLEVNVDGVPLKGINELEYVKGAIFANVWPTDWIAIVSPETGNVTGLVDLHGILPEESARGVDVLNGIAYDEEKGRIFVTGKLWPRLFEIELVRKGEKANMAAT